MHGFRFLPHMLVLTTLAAMAGMPPASARPVSASQIHDTRSDTPTTDSIDQPEVPYGDGDEAVVDATSNSRDSRPRTFRPADREFSTTDAQARRELERDLGEMEAPHRWPSDDAVTILGAEQPRRGSWRSLRLIFAVALLAISLYAAFAKRLFRGRTVNAESLAERVLAGKPSSELVEKVLSAVPALERQERHDEAERLLTLLLDRLDETNEHRAYVINELNRLAGITIPPKTQQHD